MRICSSSMFHSRRLRATSLGDRPVNGFPSDALNVMGSLLDDSEGGILVFLLAIRGRLLRRGPFFDADFFLYWWGFRAAGGGGGVRKRVASSYSGAGHCLWLQVLGDA